MPHHSISAAGATARIKAQGAELCSFITPAGTELLWQAHPAWPQHAPNLFPIVGTLRANRYRHNGRSYELFRHGFARHAPFEWTARTPTTARLVLTDSPATRAVYPFAFRLEIAYAIAGNGLTITFTLQNTGAEPLPASMGAHPAFNWPLRPGIAKEAHRLTFAAEETAPIRRVRPDGLLRPESLPTPIAGHILALHDGLFAEDALILDPVASTALRYGAPGTETVAFAWGGFPQLGIWTRPGMDLLCLEPWHGVSDPVDYDGDISGKPGMMILPPGTARTAWHRIQVLAPDGV